MPLIVLAKDSASVPHLEAIDAGVRRFVGRKHDMSVGTTGGFVPRPEPEEVADRAEYRQAIKEGDLWAADAATAALCGVKFDPHFGDPPVASKPVTAAAAVAKRLDE